MFFWTFHYRSFSSTCQNIGNVRKYAVVTFKTVVNLDNRDTEGGFTTTTSLWYNKKKTKHRLSKPIFEYPDEKIVRYGCYIILLPCLRVSPGGCMHNLNINKPIAWQRRWICVPIRYTDTMLHWSGQQIYKWAKYEEKKI